MEQGRKRNKGEVDCPVLCQRRERPEVEEPGSEACRHRAESRREYNPRRQTKCEGLLALAWCGGRHCSVVARSIATGQMHGLFAEATAGKIDSCPIYPLS